MPEPGTMNYQCELWREYITSPATIDDPEVREWKRVRTFMVSMQGQRENEKFSSGALQRFAVRAVKFRCWFTKDIFETDQIRCGGHTYDVKGIREMGLREALEISAEAQPEQPEHIWPAA